MTDETRIGELRKRLDALRLIEDEARKARLQAEADLEEAQGDAFGARWTRALIAGDSETAHRCFIEATARRVVRYGTRIEDSDLSDAHRAQVAAEVERLRAEDSGPRTSGEPG